MPDRRLKALWDVRVPAIRESAGVHEYDGIVMDLSPSGRKAALDRLGPSSRDERLADRHDERHLSAAEQGARAEAEAEVLRWNPLPHIENLDLSCYDREYAPEPQRRRAREAHLAQWPEAADASLESLQAVPAPVAGALLPAVRGLAAGINGMTGVAVAALEAHTKLLGRIQEDAASGNPDASLGATALACLLGHPESMPVDLGRLEQRADQERDRLRSRLREACERLSPGVTLSRLVPQLLRDHIHRGTMTVDDATARFEADAFLLGPAARSEATRATYDPTYGRYTWGKLEIMSLRDQALAAWGAKFSLRRFHEALLALGAPPLGTMGDALLG
jgi:hypothetical protein